VNCGSVAEGNCEVCGSAPGSGAVVVVVDDVVVVVDAVVVVVEAVVELVWGGPVVVCPEDADS
jgi:hypothetical protein